MSFRYKRSTIFRLRSAVQYADKRFAEMCEELTLVQFIVLWALQKPAIQVEVVNLTGIDRSTLSVIIDGLVKDGLVTRSKSTEDKRARIVTLTPKGTKLLTKAIPAYVIVDKELRKL